MSGRSIVMCDPPWNYKVWSKKGAGRSAESHYKTQPDQWLMDMKPDIQNAFGDSKEDSIMGMWATKPTLPFAIELLEHWGYKYKTVAFTWIKLVGSYHSRFQDFAETNENIPMNEVELIQSMEKMLHVGMGHYTRANAEFVLIGKKGKSPLQRMRRNVREVILYPIMKEHSRKPDEANNRMELMLRRPQDTMYELFARRQYKDWWCTGDELDGLDIRRALTLTDKTLEERIEINEQMTTVALDALRKLMNENT